MKNLPQFILLIIVAMLATPSQGESVFLGLALGNGDIDFTGTEFNDLNLGGEDLSDTVLSAEAFLGYEFDNNAFVEISYVGYDSIDLFLIADIVDVDSLRLAVGYTFPSSRRVNLFAKGGIGFWDLKVKESFLFNPGPEETVGLDGNDFFIQLGAHFRLSNSIKIGLSYEHEDYSFDSVNSIRLTTKFSF